MISVGDLYLNLINYNSALKDLWVWIKFCCSFPRCFVKFSTFKIKYNYIYQYFLLLGENLHPKKAIKSLHNVIKFYPNEIPHEYELNNVYNPHLYLFHLYLFLLSIFPFFLFFSFFFLIFLFFFLIFQLFFQFFFQFFLLFFLIFLYHLYLLEYKINFAMELKIYMNILFLI